MIRRVRTPDGRNLDVDMGPAIGRMAQNLFAISASTGADMMPILKDGGNSIADKGRHARKAFSIHMENRFNASQLPRKVTRCGYWMARTDSACERLPSHEGSHATLVAIEKQRARHRARRLSA